MLPQTSLAVDSRSLDRLKTQASADPATAGKEAARQFEALFMQSLIKSMRDATPKSDLFGGEESQTYTAMLDQQLAQSFAGRPGGLAEAIAKQIDRLTSKPGGNTAASKDGAVPASDRKGVRAPGAVPPSSQAAPTAVGKTVATLEQQAFVDKLWQPALVAEKSTGIPARFIVAQAALETGWGKREIRQNDGTRSHNLFGIKATASWTGDTTTALTTEFTDGKAARQRESYRAYGSYADSMTDWANLISKSSRYSTVVRDGQTAQGFAAGLQRAGYATDPHYANKLTQVINQTLALKRSSA